MRTCLMYHAACKVEFQPFTRSYSQLTFFCFLSNTAVVPVRTYVRTYEQLTTHDYIPGPWALTSNGSDYLENEQRQRLTTTTQRLTTHRFQQAIQQYKYTRTRFFCWAFHYSFEFVNHSVPMSGKWQNLPPAKEPVLQERETQERRKTVRARIKQKYNRGSSSLGSACK